MARLRRSKRVATSAAQIANQRGASPTSRLATDSRATVNAEARKEQGMSGSHRGTTSRKRPARDEDVLLGLPKLTRKRQKRGLRAARKPDDQAYKPLAEGESEELERSDKEQASSTTDEGLDTDQIIAPKKAMADKSVRFEDLPPERLQKCNHRRLRSEYEDFLLGDNPEEGSDSDVQDFVAGGSQVKHGNTRDQLEENEVQSGENRIKGHTGEQGADASDLAAELQLQNEAVRYLGETPQGHVTVMEEVSLSASEVDAVQLDIDKIETGGPHSHPSSEEASSDDDNIPRTEITSFDPSIHPSPLSRQDLKIRTHYRRLKLLSWQWATTHFSPSTPDSCPNLLHLSTTSPSLLTYINYISACTNQTWEQIFTAHRAILVYCILGKMLEVHVFGHEAFGISEQQTEVLRQLDLLCVNNDGKLSPLLPRPQPLQSSPKE
ncbi:hypothetical protein JMJ35_008534 [Cladonia borealis]|uniref:Uncharacterized protein n=1 Tax=Cladonia borealis TaxID=184061 RepID=A0AA39QU11_9LECA|nr:hypothetical protein JMJ35_008534 [Cladonia borealis]